MNKFKVGDWICHSGNDLYYYRVSTESEFPNNIILNGCFNKRSRKIEVYVSTVRIEDLEDKARKLTKFELVYYGLENE